MVSQTGATDAPHGVETMTNAAATTAPASFIRNMSTEAIEAKIENAAGKAFLSGADSLRGSFWSLHSACGLAALVQVLESRKDDSCGDGFHARQVIAKAHKLLQLRPALYR